MTTTLLDTPPAVLAPALDAAARRYIAARTRSGDALLEAVAALADARAAAQHGQWSIFLAAVGLDDSRARALIRLHDACLTDRALADRVRSGWLSEAAARELLPAPPDVRAAVLDAAEPPTLADVREAKRAATPDLHRVQTTPEARDADGPWFKARKSANHPTAHHWNIRPTERGMYVAACGIECADLLAADANVGLCSVCARHADRRALVPWTMPNRAATPDLSPEPDLADMLLRLDAHGYNRIGERQKGMTTFYRFLNYGTGDEHEYAAGELPYLLSDLDASAARAEARRAAYEDARQRFAALGYDLRRDAGAFSLYQPGGELYATTTQLDPQLKTLTTFEAGALKRAAERKEAAAPVPHLPDDWADASARASRIGLHLTMNALGQFKLTDANGAIVGGSVFGGADGWARILALLDRKEAAAAVATVRGIGASTPRIDAGALGTLGTRLTETTDPRELATLYRAIGLMLAAGGVLPALPTRPRAPRSADVGEQLAYLGKLEDYVVTLEDRLGVRE